MSTTTVDVSTQTKKKGFLKSKTTTTHDTSSTSSAIGSTVVGGSIDMTAMRDINVTGSTVLAEGALSLAAGNNLTIAAATDTHTESHSVEVKKKGLTGGFSNGVVSIGVGKSSSASQASLNEVTQVGSIVASAGGNTRLQAGEQLSVIASDIGAGKDLTLAGKSVLLGAAQDTSVEMSAQQSKSSGISVGVTVNPLAAFKSAKEQSEQGNQTESTVGKFLKQAEAIGKGVMAAMTPIVVQAGSRSASASQEHTVRGTGSARYGVSADKRTRYGVSADRGTIGHELECTHWLSAYKRT